MTPTLTVAWFTPGVKDTTGALVAWASRSRFCHVGLAIGDARDLTPADLAAYFKVR